MKQRDVSIKFFDMDRLKKISSTAFTRDKSNSKVIFDLENIGVVIIVVL